MVSIDRLTFMIAYGDIARADIAITPDKCYYRFMTQDSLEDGELPGMHDGFETFATQLCDIFKPGIGISTDISPLRFSLFINNRSVTPAVLNHDTLKAWSEKLAGHYDEMSFLLSLIHV